MVSTSFVKSAYSIKDQETRRQVNFRNTKIRYLIIVIACFVVFGCEYCFDNPSALESSIQQNQQIARHDALSPFEFNLLYSLYAFPNIIVPLFGGMLIDSKGPRIALILTAIVCVIGQSIFTIGGMKNVWMVMLAGRFVFGLGGEVLHAAQNTIISRWFKASQLSMVLGICISFPKMGSSLNAVLSTNISSYYQQHQKWEGLYANVGMPLLVGLGFMIFSLILAFILAYYDRRTQKQQRSHHETEILSNSKKINKKTPITNKKSLISKIPQSQYSPSVQPKSPKKSIISKIPQSQIQFENENTKNGLSKHPSNEVEAIQRTYISINDKQGTQQGGHLNWRGIKQLPITYWLLLLVSMLAEALFIPFLDNGNSYFLAIYKHIEKPQQAGTYLILPYVVSSVLVIPLGFFTDRIKNRGYLLIGSTCFIFATYSFMMYVQTDSQMRDSVFIPWIPVVLLGVCICIFCTIIVPTVPMICPPQLLGTGFGMMEMLQNLALGIFPLISGFIRSTQQMDDQVALGQLKGFHMQTSFFYLISCLCVSLAIFLEAADRFRGNKLKVKDFRRTYVTKIMKQSKQ